MVKILCVGDLHIMESNIEETHLMIDRILDVIAETKPDRVMFMGDTLDRFDIYRANPVSAADAALRRISSVTPLILLIGNHDIPTCNDFMSSKHVFILAKDIPGLTIVDTQCHLFHLDGMTFAAVPYVPKGRLMEALNTNPDFDISKVTAVFGHQEVRGSKLKAGTVSGDGDMYHIDYPPFVSGHIHGYHRPQENVIYVGTPRQVKYDETEEKTISLFEFADGKLVDERRINLNLPPHLELRVSAAEVETWTPPEQGHIKIVIYGTYSANKAVKSNPKITRWRQRGIMVVYDYLDEDSALFELVDAGPSQSQRLAYESLLCLRFNQEPRYLNLFNRLMNRC